MKCVICTLFEKDYHYGVAVLVNSLCAAGFAGNICAGFRGPLPPWAEGNAKPDGHGRWEMEITPQVRILFLELDTAAHFTNFKPEFLLQVESCAGSGSDAVIYCDPDLVFQTDWQYIVEWLSCGVALCEDINSPFPANHPRRVGWRRFFEAKGYHLNFREVVYANGGFIGLRWEHRQLLIVWRDFQADISKFLGGSDVTGIEGGRGRSGAKGFADCFSHTDQDALNAALEACPEMPTSFLGRAAMGFQPGDIILPHALGPYKPWRRRYVREALSGIAPTIVDKAFWKFARHPIALSSFNIGLKMAELRVAAAISRFIRRN